VSGGSGLTVGICTRDRAAALGRCLASLRHLEGPVALVVVVDDGSSPPVERGAVRDALAEEIPFELVRHPVPAGVAAGRNRVAELAPSPWLLFLDDDALALPNGADRLAVAVLERDASVAAVAFAQADGDGVPYPPGAQPAPATTPSLVRSFIGFAHLVRRDALLRAGGYRELLEINGEERELSLRLLDAGHRIVYLPAARFGHLAVEEGRAGPGRLLFLLVRNDVLISWLDHPLPVALAGTPARLLRYFRMRRAWGIHDPGGFGRILRALAEALPLVRRERRPVAWRTLREWGRLRSHPPYEGP
jgi:GT2 family glycosyltransferase